MELLIIDAGRQTVSFVRFQKKGGSFFFQGAERRSLEDQDTFESVVRAFGDRITEETRTFLSLDEENIFCRELVLSISDRRKQRAVLPLELKGETAVAVEKLVFDALSLDQGKVLAIWTSEADIESRIASLREAGLEPEIVGLAVFHWHLLVPETGDEAIALSDGRSLAVYSGKKPVLFRCLDNGNFQEDIVRTLVLLEVGKGLSVERVLLHGAAALTSHAGRVDDVSFAPLSISGKLAAAFPSESMALEYAGAWALAEASLVHEPVNFRHGKHAYTAARELLKRKLRLTAILSALFLLLLLGETGLRYYLVKKDLTSLNKSISQIYREVFPNRTKAVDEVSELKSEIRRLGGFSSTQEILQTLNGIANAKSGEVSGVYEADIDGDQVRLKGDAKSFQAANEFKSRLAPLFTTAEMDEIKSKADGSVAFSFRGTLKERVQ
ncbi:MAG TPA: type II secretion system protein GspL [Geobacteraceae bacterium]|nr:type II secretion system protein GspL [Geobacteraceae bacterium]